MKRAISLLLALVLLTGLCWAEGMDQLNTYVTRQGFKVSSAKNKVNLLGCWLTEDALGDTLQWSDGQKLYTVKAQPGAGLRGLYADLIGMADWDTCTYTYDGEVVYAYNAPEVSATKTYKTLTNYVKYVSAALLESEAPDLSQAGFGRQKYVLNTSTGKFHRPDCAIIDRMKRENRENYTGTRDELIKLGYEPCQKCKP